MTKKAMSEWKSYFVSLLTLQNYLVNLYISRAEKKDQAMFDREREIVASVASLLMEPIVDDDDRQNIIFRWSARSKEISELSLSPAKQELRHSLDIKKVLQLRVSNFWVDWVYVSSSKVKEEDEGLFAARDFRKNFIIGFYSGEVVWQADVVGGDKPSDEELAASGVIMNDYCLPIRDRNCRMVVVDPTSGKQYDDSIPLRMGMHFMKETDVKSKANVRLINDGSVQCTSNISCYTELLLFAEAEDSDEKPAAQIANPVVVTESEVLSEEMQLSAKKKRKKRHRSKKRKGSNL